MANEVQGQFGGRVSFTFGQVQFTLAEAEVRINPAVYDVQAKANQDGSACYELKPELVGAEMDFRNVNDIDWAGIFLQIGNVTITEIDNGRTHLFTGTRFVGKPEINVSTGDVKGLQIKGGTYQKLNNS